ncbi:Uncharacterised protein [Anaerotruncus sp. 2789STDY5834896]|uniref:Uncharacterized protein n=1 Tax=uncultured Anaerotruncus sp. TaxID=905011 RepID=A0A1C6G0H7_9FIRM|nr:Uncharacterised protein [uncultured Anaerotruncus sp.]
MCRTSFHVPAFVRYRDYFFCGAVCFLLVDEQSICTAHFNGAGIIITRQIISMEKHNTGAFAVLVQF